MDLLPHISTWLDVWAEWSRSTKGKDLGFSNRSPVHKFMTECQDVTSKVEFRGKRYLIQYESANGDHRYIQRAVDPMRAVETMPSYRETIPPNPKAEMMEEAFLQLAKSEWRDAIWLKHKAGFSNPTAASTMSVSLTKYKELISHAYTALDSFLRGRYPEQCKGIVIELEALKSNQVECEMCGHETIRPLPKSWHEVSGVVVCPQCVEMFKA